jgi:hypothetical protein
LFAGFRVVKAQNKPRDQPAEDSHSRGSLTSKRHLNVQGGAALGDPLTGEHSHARGGGVPPCSGKALGPRTLLKGFLTRVPRSSTRRSSLQEGSVQISHEEARGSNPLTSTAYYHWSERRRCAIGGAHLVSMIAWGHTAATAGTPRQPDHGAVWSGGRPHPPSRWTTHIRRFGQAPPLRTSPATPAKPSLFGGDLQPESARRKRSASAHPFAASSSAHSAASDRIPDESGSGGAQAR